VAASAHVRTFHAKTIANTFGVIVGQLKPVVKPKSASIHLAKVILSIRKRRAKVRRAYLDIVNVRPAWFRNLKVAFATSLISLGDLVGTIGCAVTFGGIDRGGKRHSDN